MGFCYQVNLRDRVRLAGSGEEPWFSSQSEGPCGQTSIGSETKTRLRTIVQAVTKQIAPLVIVLGVSLLVMSSDCPAGTGDSSNPSGRTIDSLRSGKTGERTGRSGLDNTPAGGTLPGGTVPGGTLPGGTLPGGTVPGGTFPNKTLPGGTVPGGMVPGGTLPGGTVPGGTVQSKKLPGE